MGAVIQLYLQQQTHTNLEVACSHSHQRTPDIQQRVLVPTFQSSEERYQHKGKLPREQILLKLLNTSKIRVKQIETKR
jgi:hypothetical protein